MNGIGDEPPTSSPKLTPDQAARVDRTRGVLLDICAGGDAMNLAYHLCALEAVCKDMLRLIGELTGGEQ